MVNWDGIRYHLNRHKLKYFLASLMLIFLLLGIIFTAVGSHESNTSLAALGILILIFDGCWMIGYASKLICCPDTNCCCEEHNWQTYNTV